jgi:hypothetical protein
MCEVGPVTVLDDRDDHVKADGEDSDHSLASLFEDSAALAQDSTDTNSNLDPVCRERVPGTEVKHMDRSRAGQSHGEFIASTRDRVGSILTPYRYANRTGR